MSAYLMTELDTFIIAAAAVKYGCAGVATVEQVATRLRSCNNAALALRYGDKPQRLTGRARLAPLAVGYVADGITVGGLYNHALTLQHLAQLVDTFEYQCSEGDVMETHKGATILRRLSAFLSAK